MKRSFRSTKGIGNAVRVLLITGIVINGAMLMMSLAELSFFPGVFESEAELSSGELIFGLVYFGVAMLTVFVFIGTAVTFLIWMHRSYSNLFAFNVQKPQTTPGWVVGHWFIPLIAYYYPLRSMNEIYHGSDPDLPSDATRFGDSSTTFYHGSWWGFWVVLSIVGNITFRLSMRSESPKVLEIVEYVDLFTTPFWMVCGWLAYEVVTEITKRQEIVGSQLVSNLPPPPPSNSEFHDGSVFANG